MSWCADKIRIVKIAVLLWCVFFLVLVGLSIWFADNRLVYTLDDPYIHLAVSENILRGGYGVNFPEYSSPSSSILYPYILAATGFMGSKGPLLVNGVATIFTVILLAVVSYDVISPAVAHKKPWTRDAIIIGAALVLMLATNSFALPMTGMEHSLHVLVSLAALFSLYNYIKTGQNVRLLAVCVVALPFIRFEGLALTVGILLTLGLLGRIRLVLVITAAIAVLFLCYGYVMTERSLPLLPSSVLIKSNIARSASDGGNLVWSILANLGNIPANHKINILLLLLALAYPMAMLILSRQRQAHYIIAFPAAIALAGHLVAGRYDWFFRYEVYLYAICLFASLLSFLDFETRSLKTVRNLSLIGLVFATASICTLYLIPILATPVAARGVYEQQMQMHRFAADYLKKPVAVNDLGLVSYQNDLYVLDLWGLGSEEVRKARVENRFDLQLMQSLCEKNNVVAAAVYESWFPGGFPASWVKVGALITQQVTAASDTVTFFATGREYESDVRKALENLKAALPVGAQIKLFDPDEH